MKTNMIRAFVLTLTLAGLAASAVTSAHASRTTVAATSTTKVTDGPMCVPSDPSYCGLK